jgi:hypothetical protein
MADVKVLLKKSGRSATGKKKKLKAWLVKRAQNIVGSVYQNAPTVQVIYLAALYVRRREKSLQASIQTDSIVGSLTLQCSCAIIGRM